MRVALAIIVLSAAPVTAEKQKIAVLEFEVTKGLDLDRTYFSDKVRGSVQDRAPQLFVMTRESTEMLLQQFGQTLAECVGECEVETGRKLGADYVISGRITKVGRRLALTMRLHATATGELLKTAESLGKDADVLVDEADGAVATLLRPLIAEATSNPRMAPAPGTVVPKVAPPPARADSSISAAAVERKSRLPLVRVPGGRFQFQGERTVSVNDFRMGQTAVTVAAYKRCVDAGACAPLKLSTGGACNWGKDRTNHPINCINWKEANRFCKWINGRLPTEEEREYVAAGGSENRVYPWGADPNAQSCWGERLTRYIGQGIGTREITCAVGSYETSDSKWGLQDLAGNVREWTSTNYDSGNKVVRGSSWTDVNPDTRLARYRTGQAPSVGYDPATGFRCVLEAPGGHSSSRRH